jgi:hypothetical protein
VAQRSYQQVTFVGKSLGTLAMGHLLTTETSLPQRKAVWLTPLVRIDALRQQIEAYGGPSLFVIGTADPQYDRTYLAEVQKATGGEVVAIEGADHGMNIGDDVLASIQALDKVMRAIAEFID